MQPVLGRGDDPGLVLAVEVVAQRVGGVRTVRGGRVGLAHAAYGERPGQAGRRGTTAEQAAPREPGAGRHQASTAAVRRDSGSESASTASASSLTSAALRAS